ncbi:dynein regulatory complex subunit 2 [Sphaeramia orbicularis]|uniref:dynein regulatory complex subunit 2 n=1 Tax=Sphaeramia orbicularis TaxID=375764 RepID=UPI00117D99C5|nr:dynein regulatory complex subunit 2-like [Sphaeramia orbicularis]
MPKKSKRGGGGKGGGRTEEERLLYLQQRAQAEEEMAKKKEEMLFLFLKDKLQREEKNTSVNLLKINEGWRSILRQTRTAELRIQVSVMSQTFERELDGLDGIIKNLEGDLLEAERQQAQVQRCHLQHLEALWSLQGRRLALVQQQWEGGVKHLGNTFSSDRLMFVFLSLCLRRLMADQTRHRYLDLNQKSLKLDQKYESVMDEIHNVYNQSIAFFHNSLMDKKAVLLQQSKEMKAQKAVLVQDARQNYTDNKKQLELLETKTQRLIREMDQDVKKAQDMQKCVSALWTLLSSSQAEQEPVIQDLISSKAAVTRRTLRLQDQLTEARNRAQKQLTVLSVQSDRATRTLQDVILQGEKLLRLSDICKNLEEKHQEFTGEEDEADTDRQKPEEEEGLPELRRLIGRYNSSLQLRAAARKRREELLRENQQLKVLLQQHLDSLTVSERTVAGRHALLTVNPAPVTMTTSPPEPRLRHTVVEAVHASRYTT